MRRAAVPLVAALLQGVVVFSPGGSSHRPSWVLGLASACGLAAGLGLWFRDRAPLTTAASVAVAYAVQAVLAGAVLPVALTIALYSAARRAGADKVFPGVAAVLLASLVLVDGALAVNGHADLAGTYSVVLLAAVVLGMALAIREGRLVTTRQAAAVEERLRIARDLHDIVGHGMGAITVQAGAGRVALEAGAVTDAARALSVIEESGRAVLREVRWLVGMLRDDERPPSLADVAQLAAAFRRTGMAADLVVEGDVTAASTAVGEAAYRIVQEALTNSLRHGAASTVSIQVAVGEQVSVDVTDDGSGHLSEQRNGTGLGGMQERAAAVGGTVSAGPSSPGPGWRVHADLPALGGRR